MVRKEEEEERMMNEKNLTYKDLQKVENKTVHTFYEEGPAKKEKVVKSLE